MNATYCIFLVLDERFGGKAIELSRIHYVWLVQSPDNDSLAEQVWQRPPNGTDPLLCGLSTFQRLIGEDAEAMIVRMLDVIDEHHGEFSHDPEWSQIDVIGASPTDKIVAAASAYGEVRCESTPNGFRLLRPGNRTQGVKSAE